MPIDAPIGCQATITRERASTCFEKAKTNKQHVNCRQKYKIATTTTTKALFGKSNKQAYPTGILLSDEKNTKLQQQS